MPCLLIECNNIHISIRAWDDHPPPVLSSSPKTRSKGLDSATPSGNWGMRVTFFFPSSSFPRCIRFEDIRKSFQARKSGGWKKKWYCARLWITCWALMFTVCTHDDIQPFIQLFYIIRWYIVHSWTPSAWRWYVTSARNTPTYLPHYFRSPCDMYIAHSVLNITSFFFFSFHLLELIYGRFAPRSVSRPLHHHHSCSIQRLPKSYDCFLCSVTFTFRSQLYSY